MLQRRMLSKEEESSTDEVQVRRADQDKINRFSTLHQKETGLAEDLKAKQKDKEDLEEVSNELELADEDELVPYKIGDSFFSLPVSRVQEMLATAQEKIDGEVAALEERIGTIREEMDGLKVELYARFGKTINLET